jgi:hypothetical protein
MLVKKAVLVFLSAIIACSFTASAQVNDGNPFDSTTIRFTSGPIIGYLPDTATIPLWQIGHGHKTFFGADTIGVTMMTDTVNYYPKNANNWFIFRFPHTFNIIIDFWHKFQTDSGHAGGIVEFSTDHGANWQNVKGACNVDSGMAFGGVLTDGFYGVNDTLATGEQAFTGTQSGMQFSRFQFFDGFPVRISKGSSGCDFFRVDSIYVRFRFISDTTADTLAGWIIDSIKIEKDNYGGGGVKGINNSAVLNISPNPSFDGIFNFPQLNEGQHFSIEIYNTTGVRILRVPYRRSIDLTYYPGGLYFYKVSDGVEYYSGRLLNE